MQLQVFNDLWLTVHDEYLYPDYNGLDWQAVRVEYEDRILQGLTNAEFYSAMSEMIFRLGDEHSSFLSPEDVAASEAEFLGENDYVGVGILVSAVPERQRGVILVVFPGSPAERAGLKSRDSILFVDGEPLLDEDGFLKPIIRGPEGSPVTLTVQTPGEEPREATMLRQRIQSAIPVPYTVLTSPSGKRIGYIFVVAFYDSTIDESVRDALEAMTAEEELDGLIFDVRKNPGGDSRVVRPIFSYFTSGDVGYFVSRNEEYPLSVGRAQDINGSQTVPLAILIGQDTVSFGEVFAGSLRDLGRATLVGETTGGNVEVLYPYDFIDGSRAYIARNSFRPINDPDADWEATGIIPDLEILAEWDEYTIENDPVILAAMEQLD